MIVFTFTVNRLKSYKARKHPKVVKKISDQSNDIHEVNVFVSIDFFFLQGNHMGQKSWRKIDEPARVDISKSSVIWICCLAFPSISIRVILVLQCRNTSSARRLLHALVLLVIFKCRLTRREQIHFALFIHLVPTTNLVVYMSSSRRRARCQIILFVR